MQMTSEVAKFSYQSECFRHDLGLLTTIKVSDKEESIDGSHPGPQDGRRRRNHGALAAAQA